MIEYCSISSGHQNHEQKVQKLHMDRFSSNEDYVYIDKESYVKRNVNDEELVETDDETKDEDPILIDTLETVDKERSFWSLLFYR